MAGLVGLVSCSDECRGPVVLGFVVEVYSDVETGVIDCPRVE